MVEKEKDIIEINFMIMIKEIDLEEEGIPKRFSKKSWAFLGMDPLRELIRPNLCVCMCVCVYVCVYVCVSVQQPLGPQILTFRGSRKEKIIERVAIIQMILFGTIYLTRIQ